MAEVASAFVSLLPSMKGFGSKVEKGLSGEMSGSGSRLGKAFGVGIAAGAGAAVAGAGIAAKFTADAAVLDTKMREVVTLFGETGAAADKSLGQVQGQVRSLSNEFGIAQDTLTSGLYSAISAGVPRDNALEFMQVASKAAIGGVTDVDTAVDGISSTINAFSLKASDAQAVADSMFAAVKGGKTTFGELSKSLFNIAPAAAAAGVSFQEVNAGVATLTAGGTPTSVATTQMRAALVGLQKPSDDLNGIFKGLGYATAQQAIEAKGLGFALGAVADAADGDNGKLQKLLGSSEAVAAANVIAGTGAKKFAAEMKNQAGAAGAASDAFDVVNKGAARQFDIFKTNATNLGLSVGQALLPGVTAILTWVNEDMGPAFDRLTVAVQPGVDAVKGLFASLGGGGAVSTMVTAFTGIASALQSNFVPVLKTAGQTFTTVVLPAVLAVVNYLRSKLMPIFSTVVGIVKAQVIPIVASLATFLYGTLYPAVVKIVAAVAAKLKPVLDALFSAIQRQILPAVQRLLARFREWQPTIQKVIVVVLKVVGAVLTFAAAILGKVLPPVIKFAAWLIGKLVGAISTVIGWIVKVIGAVVNFGVGLVNAIKAGAKFYAGIILWIGKAIGFIAGLPGKAISALGDLGSTLLSAGADLVGGFIEGIRSMAGNIITAIREAITDKLPSFVKKALGIASPSKVFKRIGQQTAEGMVVGLRSMERRVGQAAERVGKAATTGATKGAKRGKVVFEFSREQRLELLRQQQSVNDLARSLKKDGKDALRGLPRKIAVLELRAAKAALRRAKAAPRREFTTAAKEFSVTGKAGVGEARREVAEFKRSIVAAGGTWSKATNRSASRLLVVSKNYDALNKALGQSRQGLADLRTASSDFANTVAGSWSTSGLGVGGVGAWRTQLEANRNDSKAMTAALQQAVAKGLDGPAFQALASSADLSTAQELAAMSASDIADLERLYSETTKAQAQLGEFASRQVYGKQIADQSALIATQTRTLNNLDVRLAGLEAAVERGARAGLTHQATKAQQRKKVRR